MAGNRFGLSQANGTRRLSKVVKSHPAVAECGFGPDGGSDYKYDVLLKAGWAFKCGRMAGCRSGFFNSTDDFLYAEPVPAVELDAVELSVIRHRLERLAGQDEISDRFDDEDEADAYAARVLQQIARGEVVIFLDSSMAVEVLIDALSHAKARLKSADLEGAGQPGQEDRAAYLAAVESAATKIEMATGRQVDLF